MKGNLLIRSVAQSLSRAVRFHVGGFVGAVTKFFYAAIPLLVITAPAESRYAAKETVDASSSLLPISSALHAKNSKIALRDDVRLYFGERAPTSAASAPLGVAYASGEAKAAATVKGKTKSKSRTDESACKEAMRSALARLIEQARQWKGNAVVRIVSYANSVERASATQYECRVDAARAVVELKGDVVTLGPRK